ncbi:MAG: alpha-mannosidase, partial [Candidatus Melainabacteria bacterium]|nr:alpha-mannosidase [Candidatus Melainabacteria bacterium]
MPKNRTHAYFQTHWDREWYEPFPLYQQRLAEVVKTLLAQLNTSQTTLPRFTLDGQTALLTDVQPLLTPAENEALQRHLASGRLHVGPWFVMPDTVLVGAESLIRNLQLGMQTAKSYGATEFTGYLPDTFGQPSSLPALFQGMGIETAIV